MCCARDARVVYVQVAGGALPLELSDAVRTLDLAARASVAPCFGGDARCVSVASALLWAAAHGEVAVCSVGPGIVGTSTRFGHGAVSLAEAANVASALGGRPVLAARMSEADQRERHRGLSHHTEAVLDLALAEIEVSSPRMGKAGALHARGCRSRTWVAARTRIPFISRLPSAPAVWRRRS